MIDGLTSDQSSIFSKVFSSDTEKGGLFSSGKKDPVKQYSELQLTESKVKPKKGPESRDMLKFTGATTMGFLMLDNTLRSLGSVSPGAAAGGGLFGGLFGPGGLGEGIQRWGPSIAAAAIPFIKSAGKFLMSPIGSLLAGGVMMVADAIGGVQKAEEWGVDPINAGFAGAIAGSGEGVLGFLGNVAKWTLIGGGIGSTIPIIGTVVGGVTGAVVGIATALIGPERVARGTQWLSDNISNAMSWLGDRFSDLGVWIYETVTGEDWEEAAEEMRARTEESFNFAEDLRAAKAEVTNHAYWENEEGQYAQNVEVSPHQTVDYSGNQMHHLAWMMQQGLGGLSEEDFTANIEGFRADLDYFPEELQAYIQNATYDAYLQAFENIEWGEGSTLSTEEIRSYGLRRAEQDAINRAAARNNVLINESTSSQQGISLQDGIFSWEGHNKGALFNGQQFAFDPEDDLYLMASTNPARDALAEEMSALRTQIGILAEAVTQYKPQTNVINNRVQERSLMGEQLLDNPRR